MAAPAYVAGGTFANTSTKDSDLTVPLPVGWAAGQHAFLQVQTVEQGSGNTAPSIVGPASGWRPLGPEIHASGFVNTRQVRSRIYYRLLQAGDTDPVVRMTGGTATGVNVSGKISTFSDVGVIRLGTATTGGTSPISIPGITTRTANELAVAFLTIADGNTVSGQAFTDPAAPTERHDHTVGSRVGVSMATGTRATAGATGNFTATPSATDPWAGIVMAFGETSSFPGQAVLDDFNRADGLLGGSWTVITGTPDIISNTVGDSGSWLAEWPTALTATGEASVKIATLPANGTVVYLYYRIAGSNGYVLEVWRDDAETDYWLFYRIDAGVWAFLETIRQELVSGDSVGVTFDGGTHTFYARLGTGLWVQAGTFTDGTYVQEGKVRIGSNSATARLDDFTAGPLVGDTTAPGPATLVTAVQQTSTSAYVQFNTPADADVSFYRIRYKTGAGQTFSGPTDGTLGVADTATSPSVTVGSSTITGLTTGQAYTFAVFIGDEVPNWSTAATDDITLAPQVEFTPTITATQSGPVTIGIILPGEATASFTVAMAAEAGTPIGPSEVALTPTITAVMAGRIILREETGKDRGAPRAIKGPLGGAQVDPSLVAPRPGGRSARQILAGIGRGRR